MGAAGASPRLSKFLSLVLRHKPEAAGVTLDREGFVAIDVLLAGCAANGVALTRAELLDIVAASDKQRFALSEDGLRVRANQGHSIDVDLALEPLAPPAVLYHGTVARFLDAILREGLLAGERTHVHLSADLATARAVGARRGIPIVLDVDAAAMHRDAHTFFRSANGVWLTAAVPPRYLRTP